ncbi:hypothetical protein QQP08_018257 [Theobroma cacao]|nr:hypothetical protein QQP08_018257 [Theobroma cacao]
MRIYEGLIQSQPQKRSPRRTMQQRLPLSATQQLHIGGSGDRVKEKGGRCIKLEKHRKPSTPGQSDAWRHFIHLNVDSFHSLIAIWQLFVSTNVTYQNI